ncbi:uncharacterized protein [Tiliqua scincoides]|uniref:uncharacterized protein n=1 Tax=Tiliqua scincoides TaxID=71010 RepID=UPI0034635F67
MDPAERLLKMLQDLPDDQLRIFCFHLGNLSGQPSSIPRGKLSGASPVQVAELLAQHYPGEELDVAADVLRKIPRLDLVERCRLPGGTRRTGGEPPGMNATSAATPWQPRQVSDQKLMILAKNMGKNWKQIGIEFLGAKMSRLEQIEEENQNQAVMRAFCMLVDWRNRERERATAAQLYVILNQKGVPLDKEAYAFLVENA